MSEVALRLMLLSLGLIVLVVFGILLARSLGRLIHWRYLRARQKQPSSPPDPWQEAGRRLIDRRGEDDGAVDLEPPSRDDTS